ncbi:hypothetical protein GCM10012284_08440 [Mangrovihabitans endophyticus]|uniref:KAP NTPase domain-containing protein n=1 Tax=Mangrovihabitans endophyticus TaxID=1751298 RepID=A0A8J3BWZ8_9ACTN|nr:hypothetical protein GCM10012284_08440 [Mangrovihabitans endophyticus]
MSDAATVEDHLGFARFAVPLAEYIAGMEPSRTPWTVGVYGEWGSGKTSFLRQVSAELTARGLEPVWFNAWKYAREQDLWQALIQTILDRVRVAGPPPRRAWVKLRLWFRSVNVRAGLLDLSGKLFVLLFRVALIALFLFMAASVAVPSAGAALTGALDGLPALQELLGEPWARVAVALGAALAAKPESLFKIFDVRLGFDLATFRKRRSYREKMAFLEEFSADFRDIVRIVCRDRPLVVIIDDLDRCLPEQTLQIVETIKLFLDVEGCVFLVAVDRDIIENAVAVQYRDLASHEGLLRRISETYFEKIVQLPFSLPPVPAPAMDNLIRAVSDDEDVHRCLPILRGGPPYNPRRIKRLVQTFTLLKSLAAGAFEESSPPVPALLAKIVVIQARYRDVYDAIVDEPSLLAALEQAYRAPASEPGEVADRQLLDDERARLFATRHPDLPDVFQCRISAADSFALVSTSEYLSFVRAVVPPDAAGEASEPEAPPTFAVWHRHRDAGWAEWFARQLSDAGYPVQLTGLDGAPGADARPDYVVVVLSRAAAEETPAQHWAAVRVAAPRVLVAKVGPVPVPPLLADRDVLTFDGLQEVEARAVLLSALDPRHRRPADLGASRQTESSLPYPGRSLRVTNVRQPSTALVERRDLRHRVDVLLGEVREADTPTVCALIGMPGAGKTEAARQYALRHADEYQIVWWIDGSRPAAIEAGLRDMAHEWNGRWRPDADPRTLLGEPITGVRRWLLIIDGAADPATVGPHLPPAVRGDILVTSRLRSWSQAARQIEVAPFEPAESAELLGIHLTQESPRARTELADVLGHLPSALHAAVTFLSFASVPVEEFRRRLDAEDRALLERTGLVTALTPDPVQVVVPAFVASRPLPRALAGASEEALGALREQSLAHLHTDRVRWHPMVQLAVRAALDPERSRRVIADTLAAIGARTDVFLADPVEGTVTDHLAALLRHGTRLGVDAARLHAGLLTAARALIVHGNYVHAGRVAGLAAARPGATAGQRARARTVVAEALLELGRAAEAIPLLPPGDDTVVVRVRAHIQAGDVEAALTLQNRQAGAADLATMVNLADINRLGSPRVARQVLGPVLAQYRRDHPDDAPAARALTTLAGVAVQMDDREEARGHYEQALTIQRRVLHAGHPDIAQTLRPYAAVLASLNELDHARDALREAITIWTAVAGPTDRLVTGLWVQLAQVCRELADETGLRLAEQRVREARAAPPSAADLLAAEHSTIG